LDEKLSLIVFWCI